MMATKKVEEAPARRGRGRPSAFDREAALREAMKLFWEQGYEGTSFEQLTQAMGISPSSFYNSFGSKEALYREAVDAYMGASSTWFVGALTGDTDGKTAFTRLLESTAVEFTRDDLPSGCMVSLAGTHLADGLEPVRQLMASYRADAREMMAKRLERSVEEGELAADTDVQGLAGYFNAIARGLAVQARDGGTRDDLLKTARVAMQVWPASAAPWKRRKGAAVQ